MGDLFGIVTAAEERVAEKEKFRGTLTLSLIHISSILENVRMAKPDATREEIAHALEAAQCLDIIEKLPNGIDTVDVYKRHVFLLVCSRSGTGRNEYFLRDACRTGSGGARNAG